MTFVTRLVLRSGDRRALDAVADDVKGVAERKGVALKGPHSHPPTDLSVPRYRRLHADDDRRFESWSYTVYTRELAIHGHQEFARDVVGRDYPDSVHVEVAVDRIHEAGGAGG